MAEYETFMHRWFGEVWNQKNEAAIDEMCDENVIANGLTDAAGDTVRGIASYKNLFRTFLAAYPDIEITVEDTISEGDKIVARCRVSATHTGDGLGITATNQPVEFTGIAIVRLKDGKIVEAWNEFDFLKMFSQVGAVSFNAS
jgi:predicted ester cyclase